MLKCRTTCPDVLFTRIEEAVDARLYLLRQTGPTGFLVKEHDSDKKFKVCLGSHHSCDCTIFLKEKELCLHLLWILIKKFRIPKDSQVVYQLGLGERELDNVVYGKKEVKKKVEKTASAGNNRDTLKQKTIEEDDVCPICQEDIFKNKRLLTFCRFGCGNSVHINCMKIWADHQYKASGEELIKCPLCRTGFANYKHIVQEYSKAATRKKSLQKKSENSLCRKCKTQINAAQSFRCCTCDHFWLCLKCFQCNYHSEHNFEFKKSPKERWNLASRRSNELELTPSVLNLQANERHITDTGRSRIYNNVNARKKEAKSILQTRNGSEPDLRKLTFGVSGMQINEQKEKRQPTIRRKNSPSGLPPLPVHKSLIANTNTPPRSFANRGARSFSHKKEKEFKGAADFSQMFLVSSPLAPCYHE